MNNFGNGLYTVRRLVRRSSSAMRTAVSIPIVNVLGVDVLFTFGNDPGEGGREREREGERERDKRREREREREREKERERERETESWSFH